MEKLKVLDLFSGIGGFSLGLERTGGFETVAFCEIEPFCQKVLAKHWPNVPCHEDATKLIKNDLSHIDVITGGFPCQDVSIAGNEEGIDDGTRSGLFGEIIRLGRDIRPKYIIMENVANLLAGPSHRRGAWFGRLLAELAKIGYDAEWHCIPSCYTGGWSKRDRVWVIAYPNDKHSKGRGSKQIFGQPDLSRELTRMATGWPGRSNLPAPRFSGTSNAVPARVDRTKSIGNAVDPTIPEIIGHAILEQERV